MMRTLFSFLIWMLLVGSVQADVQTQVVVLANGNMPESLELAKYYMQKRNIPDRFLCVLDLPRGETITHPDYRSMLADPLMAWMRKNDLLKQKIKVEKGNTNRVWSVVQPRYIVSMYGVPVRITSFSQRVKNKLKGRSALKVQTASVDSELSCLLLPFHENWGPAVNPLYGVLQTERQSVDGVGKVLMCTRLDGPSAEIVRGIIDGALKAESYGLNGYGWFDARGKSVEDAYFPGDHMIEEAFERFKREGFECYLDKNGAIFPEDLPMDFAAIYMGWYTDHVAGPFKENDFRFAPGAVAYHLHSSSARLLRTENGYWAGPLTALGASAVMGAVAEPFLVYTPNLGILSDRLCRGYNFGDAAYMALPALSWQITVIGDPLYRPFALTLDQQIEHLESEKHPGLEWAILRKVNLLIFEGRYVQAGNLCTTYAKRLGSNVLREKLADLYISNGSRDLALELYEKICQTSRSNAQVYRAGRKYVALLRQSKRTQQADDVQAWLMDRLGAQSALGRALKN